MGGGGGASAAAQHRMAISGDTDLGTGHAQHPPWSPAAALASISLNMRSVRLSAAVGGARPAALSTLAPAALALRSLRLDEVWGLIKSLGGRSLEPGAEAGLLRSGEARAGATRTDTIILVLDIE